MGRRCSHCGNNGHNSRTCRSSRIMVTGGGLRLFGVQLQIDSSASMKKSFSLNCLCASGYTASASSSSSSSSSSLFCIDEATEKIANGYLSDGLMDRVLEKRKGKLFLPFFVALESVLSFDLFWFRASHPVVVISDIFLHKY